MKKNVTLKYRKRYLHLPASIVDFINVSHNGRVFPKRFVSIFTTNIDNSEVNKIDDNRTLICSAPKKREQNCYFFTAFFFERKKQTTPFLTRRQPNARTAVCSKINDGH